MTFFLPKKSLILWQTRLLLSAVLLLLCGYLIFGIGLIFLIFDAVLLFITAILFIYLPFFHKSHEIILNKSSITVKKGVILKRTYIMPTNRLVFVRFIKTPVLSCLGLTAISLKAVRASVFIPEIQTETAELIGGWQQK